MRFTEDEALLYNLKYERDSYKEKVLENFISENKLDCKEWCAFSIPDGDYEYFVVMEARLPSNKVVVKMWVDSVRDKNVFVHQTFENGFSEFILKSRLEASEQDVQDYKSKFFKGETCGTLDGNLNKWRNRK